jgi:hypothetical protein
MSVVEMKEENFIKAKENINICLKNKIYERKILNLALDISLKLNDKKFRISILEIYIANYDADGIKYLELAKCLQDPNQYDQASYYFDVARDILPNNEEVLLETAKFHSIAKKETLDGTIISKVDHQKSKLILKNLLQKNKKCNEAIYLLGEIEYMDLNFAKAKNYFLRCYDNNFKKSNFLLQLADIEEYEKNIAAQEKLLLEAVHFIEIRPKSLAKLFNIFLNREATTKASVFGFRSILAYRRLIASLNKQIHQSLKLNNFIESKILTQNLRIHYKEISELYFRYSILKKGSPMEIKCLDKCLTFDPNHSEANYLTAQELKKKKNEECLEFYKRCIDNNWEHWQARWEYITHNDNILPKEEMISHLEMISECNPSHQRAKRLLNEINSSCV